jgi:hypothetical protein
MLSEQWKSSLFAGIAFVLVGICYVAIAQSAPILSIPLSRSYTSQAVEWPKADCRVSAMRFSAADSSLHLHDVRIIFTSGRTQLLNRFSLLMFHGTGTEWLQVDRSQRDSSVQCIDKIEVNARSVGTSGPSAKLQVEVK